MPIQDFTINTRKGYAGDMYGLSTTNSQRLTFNAEVAMSKYGVGVVQGSKANTCAVAAPGADGAILGITMREDKLESAKRPGDGTVLIPAGQPLAVMMEGAIQIELATALAGKELGMDKFGRFGSRDEEGFAPVLNVTALEYPAAAGDIIGVMVHLNP